MSTALECTRKGVSVLLIDPNGIAGGASGTPLGLVNPATGRFASLSWRSGLCFEAITENLKLAQAQSSKTFYKRTGVLRPAQNGDIAVKMKKNSETQSWPDQWNQWLNCDQVKTINTEVHCVDGGVWIPVGLTVNIKEYLSALYHILKKKDVGFCLQPYAYTLNQDKTWTISPAEPSPAASFTCSKLITCSGVSASEMPEWNTLPLIPVKGQCATFSTSQYDYDHAISASGYVSSLADDFFVMGSTYEHRFDSMLPDDKGKAYLEQRLSTVIPALYSRSSVQEMWAGVRASTPNRMPVLGRHPEIETLFLYTGLGSKGMLYSAYLSRLLMEFIEFEQELPAEVSILRF